MFDKKFPAAMAAILSLSVADASAQTCRSEPTDGVCCWDGTITPDKNIGSSCGAGGGTYQDMYPYTGDCGRCGRLTVYQAIEVASCECGGGGGGGGGCDPSTQCCEAMCC